VEFELYILTFLLLFVLLPGGIYAIYCLRFYRRQPRMVFMPQRSFNARAQTKIDHREIYLHTEDGLKLHAWYVPADDLQTDGLNEKKPVVLFCHGNAGNLTERTDSFLVFKTLGFDTFIFDYRGYGGNKGKLTEKGTYLDADAAWDFLVTEENVNPARIILFGRSLGGATAAYLAQKHAGENGPSALILESSFSSIKDMADYLFSLSPAKWLLRYRYDTHRRLKDIFCPVLVVHSRQDELIPFGQGKKNFKAANAPKAFLEIRGRHYDGFLDEGKRYIDGLRDFFQQIDVPVLTAKKTQKWKIRPTTFRCSQFLRCRHTLRFKHSHFRTGRNFRHTGIQPDPVQDNG